MDGVHINSLIHGLTNTNVLQGVFAFDIGKEEFIPVGVKTEENRSYFHALNSNKSGCFLNTGYVLNRKWIDHIKFAGEQRCNTGGSRFNRGKYGLRYVISSLVPPVRIRHKYCLDLGLPALQHEGAGSVGMPGGVGLF